LAQLKAKNRVTSLLRILEGLREIDSGLLPAFSETEGTIEAYEAKITSFPFLTLTRMIDLVIQGQPEKSSLSAEYVNLLSTIFHQFSSFGGLWSFVGPGNSQDLQVTLLVHGLFFHLFIYGKVDPAKCPWGALSKFWDEAGPLLAQCGNAGLTSFVPVLLRFWRLVASEAVSQQQQGAILYQILNFFYLHDLFSPLESTLQPLPSFKGSCHYHMDTRKQDIALLIELLDETSQQMQALTKILPAFSIPCILEQLFDPTRPDLNTEAEEGLMKRLDNTRLQAVMPLPLAENPKPIQRNLAYSAFLVFHQLLLKQKVTEDEMVDLHIRLKRKPSGLALLQLLAVRLVLLHHAAKEVSGFKSWENDIEKWKARRISDIITELLGPRPNQLFFLRSIQPTTQMNLFLSNAQACSIFKIDPSFHLSQIPKSTLDYAFPFMVTDPEKNRESKEYNRMRHLIFLEESKGLHKYVTTLCQANRSRGYLQVRVYLASIAYYLFYNESKPCPIIQKLVEEMKTTLQLNEDLLAAFRFLTSGGIAYNPDDDISIFFTNQLVEGRGKDQLTIRHLLVNLLIVTLGCPDRSVHFQVRMFHTHELGGDRAPGATGYGDNDCGYQLDATKEINRFACSRS